jgi:hypothetical protein
VVQYLPRMHQARGSILKKHINKQHTRNLNSPIQQKNHCLIKLVQSLCYFLQGPSRYILIESNFPTIPANLIYQNSHTLDRLIFFNFHYCTDDN